MECALTRLSITLTVAANGYFYYRHLAASWVTGLLARGTLFHLFDSMADNDVFIKASCFF